MRVDQSEFQRTLRAAAARTSRSLPVFMDSRMLHILKEASAQTPIADRSKIQSDLGATLRSQKVDKKGKIRRRYKYTPTPAVYAIVNWRRAKAGLPPVPKGEMADAAKKLIAGRLRAIGSLRAGWKRAIGILAASVKAGITGEGPAIKSASRATPAKPGNPTTQIEYRMVVDRGNGAQIDPRVIQAMDSGFASEQSQLIKHLEDHVRADLKSVGAL